MTNAQIFRELFRKTQLKLDTLRQQQAVYQDISITQGNALVEIGRRKQLTLNELAEILEKDKSSVSRLIHNMIKKGWVLMAVSEDDARIRNIRLTDRGEEKYQTIETEMNQLFDRLIASLSKEELDSLMASLELLNHRGSEILKQIPDKSI